LICRRKTDGCRWRPRPPAKCKCIPFLAIWPGNRAIFLAASLVYAIGCADRTCTRSGHARLARAQELICRLPLRSGPRAPPTFNPTAPTLPPAVREGVRTPPVQPGTSVTGQTGHIGNTFGDWLGACNGFDTRAARGARIEGTERQHAVVTDASRLRRFAQSDRLAAQRFAHVKRAPRQRISPARCTRRTS